MFKNDMKLQNFSRYKKQKALKKEGPVLSVVVINTFCM
jgi:hypothetical protein